MGTTKSSIFTKKQNKLAGILKALAHPARIAIVQQLLQAETCVCGSLVDGLGLAQSTVSQHLKELKKAGIIKGCVEGTSTSYCIDEKGWKQIQKDIEQFFTSYTCKDNCC